MKLWGGRFAAPPADALDRLGKSIHFDRRLHAEEIRVNQAYARALAGAGVLDGGELERLLTGLDRVAAVLAADPAPPLDDEDIHTAVERLLFDEIGALARKLPTGRSRNDLSQTEFRLYLASAVSSLTDALDRLRAVVLARAEASADTLVPGYTHLQRAQPVVFGHLLLSHFWALTRDRDRLEAAGRRASASPMGAGALAGNPYPVDREAIADELGLRDVLENSVDAVGTRDYAMEFLAAGAILGVHLSRLAEDLVLWSSAEFGFVRLDDTWSTGSSLMPQKRNPDGFELIRGKAGRLIGNLVALLTVGKGLASGYQRDLQEDKEPCFDTLDTLRLALPVAEGAIGTMRLSEERMGAALSWDLLATDLAEYLVGRGLPFRDAHRVAGEVFAHCERESVEPPDLDLATLRGFAPAFDEDVKAVWDYRASVRRRSVRGGPGDIQAQLAAARQVL
jgi:argininosuccinate lyase